MLVTPAFSAMIAPSAANKIGAVMRMTEKRNSGLSMVSRS